MLRVILPIIVSWSVTDGTTDQTTYTITIDGIDQISGTWSSGVSLPDFNVNGQLTGTHEIKITAWDGYGVSSFDIFTLTVLENHNPVIAGTTTFEYVHGDLTTYSITWTVTDAEIYSSAYSISVDGVEQDTGVNWVSGGEISFDITNWAVGTYSIVINASDGYGLSTTKTFTLTVLENDQPLISGVSDLTFVNGNNTVPVLEFIITDVRHGTTYYNIISNLHVPGNSTSISNNNTIPNRCIMS